MKLLPDVVSLIARSHLGLDGLSDHHGAAEDHSCVAVCRDRVLAPASTEDNNFYHYYYRNLVNARTDQANFQWSGRKRAVFLDGSRKSAVGTPPCSRADGGQTTAGAGDRRLEVRPARAYLNHHRA